MRGIFFIFCFIIFAACEESQLRKAPNRPSADGSEVPGFEYEESQNIKRGQTATIKTEQSSVSVPEDTTTADGVLRVRVLSAPPEDETLITLGEALGEILEVAFLEPETLQYLPNKMLRGAYSIKQEKNDSADEATPIFVVVTDRGTAKQKITYVEATGAANDNQFTLADFDAYTLKIRASFAVIYMVNAAAVARNKLSIEAAGKIIIANPAANQAVGPTTGDDHLANEGTASVPEDALVHAAFSWGNDDLTRINYARLLNGAIEVNEPVYQENGLNSDAISSTLNVAANGDVHLLTRLDSDTYVEWTRTNTWAESRRFDSLAHGSMKPMAAWSAVFEDSQYLLPFSTQQGYSMNELALSWLGSSGQSDVTEKLTFTGSVYSSSIAAVIDQSKTTKILVAPYAVSRVEEIAQFSISPEGNVAVEAIDSQQCANSTFAQENFGDRRIIAKIDLQGAIHAVHLCLDSDSEKKLFYLTNRSGAWAREDITEIAEIGAHPSNSHWLTDIAINRDGSTVAVVTTFNIVQKTNDLPWHVFISQANGGYEINSVENNQWIGQIMLSYDGQDFAHFCYETHTGGDYHINVFYVTNRSGVWEKTQLLDQGTNRKTGINNNILIACTVEGMP